MPWSNEGWLTDNIIAAAQSLLLQEYPHISGLQSPILHLHSKLQEVNLFKFFTFVGTIGVLCQT